MAAVSKGDALTPHLLRSSTPAPNEKVLNYLESMSREGEEPDNTPPRSLVDPTEFPSKVGSPRTRSALLDLAGSPLSYTNRKRLPVNGDDGDADSNVQDGRRSEAGETTLPVREPGPYDPPGPKYESYDSGPSFGNMGVLPTDDHPPTSPNPPHSWNSNWINVQPKPLPQTHWNGEAIRHDTGLTEGGQSAYPAARIPLPPSESAMSPRGTNADLHNAMERAMSPMSARSRTRGTEQGTAYPPLPESRFGDDEPTSPRVKSPYSNHKAASISPSDSPSQARAKNSKTPSRMNTRSTEPPIPETPSRSGSRQQVGRPGSALSGGPHSRPFSPYRHAPTTQTMEDLYHSAIRGRAVVIPEEDEQSPPSIQQPRSKTPSQISKAPSHVESQANGKAPSQVSQKQPSVASSRHTASPVRQWADAEYEPHENGDVTPRARSPEDLDQEEARIVRAALAATPRTSYYAEPLEPNVANHFHDTELCVLLHQESDPAAHEVVKRALRKAVVQRVKKLGMKYDQESLRKIKRVHSSHNPLRQDGPFDEPPQWASDIKRELVLMQQRIESLGPKIENLRPGNHSQNGMEDSRFEHTYTTPRTQTVHLQTQPTGTAADSMYLVPHNEAVIDDRIHHGDEDDEFEDRNRGLYTDGETNTFNRSGFGRTDPDADDSGGQQHLEEGLYRLRQRTNGSQSGATHHTWEVVRNDTNDLDDDDDRRRGDYTDREGSPPLPALPETEDEGPVAQGEVVTTAQGPWSSLDYGQESSQDSLTPWQRVHSRLLSWAVIWSQTELDQALNSTTRGQQVDELALTIWSMQTYKRYVRARLTDNPQGIVDRLFVPPNMADAISNAVYNGQHGNACGMLRELWNPYGLPGMPRLLVVLAKHRSEVDHWVVHRYSLPDGHLVTYDSFSGRTLMDGRPLGWWFAIRIAWPNANYASPDHFEQKMVRLHRPMQLPIDNSVAAAGIWRNILMGSRGERSLDLERLRDLINTEVKNLRQRKILGRLTMNPPRQPWDMN